MVPTSQRIAPSNQNTAHFEPGRFSAAIGLVLLLGIPVVLIIRIHQAISPRLLSPADPAPAFAARDLNSNKVHQIGFDGTPTALLFFSTDCPHCQRELASFDRLSRRFGDGILFLAISLSGRTKTTELIAHNRFGVRILLDEGNTGPDRFGVDVVPALFLVGADRKIAYSASGEQTFAAREQLLLDFTSSMRSIGN